MKYLPILFFGLFTSALVSQGDCSDYYPLIEGAAVEWTTYDKKGKPSAIIEYEFKDVQDSRAVIVNRVSDKDGEEISVSEFDVECKGNGVVLDIKSMYSPTLMMQYENMKTTITGSDVYYPNNLKEGDELDDAEMFISVDMSGITMNVDFEMTNRKVVGEETITVPAGEFDCVVITYDSKIKLGLERKSSGKQWLAKGVGMVQQEEYNKKGKVTSSTKLTDISK